MKRIISVLIAFLILITSVSTAALSAAAYTTLSTVTASSVDTSSISAKSAVSNENFTSELSAVADDSELSINPSAFVIIGIVLIVGLAGSYLYRKKKGLLDKKPEEDFFELLKKDKEAEREALNDGAKDGEEARED